MKGRKEVHKVAEKIKEMEREIVNTFKELGIETIKKDIGNITTETILAMTLLKGTRIDEIRVRNGKLQAVIYAKTYWDCDRVRELTPFEVITVARNLPEFLKELRELTLNTRVRREQDTGVTKEEVKEEVIFV